ncbi:hypothetical protein HDU96_001928 [Phlyctochytrium bullatum]|nr:hypothetical protein HDU96_001928 [Phlyctochytrium bullatum]
MYAKALSLLLLAVASVNAQGKPAEAAANAAAGQCTRACGPGRSEVYKLMIDSDASGRFDNSTLKCRPVTKANLPDYGYTGPFVTEALQGQNVVMTDFGPLDDADRFLVNGVRIAGLWEEPASRDAATIASCPKTKEIAALIQADHIFLDEASKEVSDVLKIPITDKLPDNIARFMQEMACMEGLDYDTVYAQRLRQAHGNIFLAIAQIRTRTRNNLIRQFATIANTVVMSHMQRLEATDLVDYSILPPSIIKKAEPAFANLQVVPAYDNAKKA